MQTVAIVLSVGRDQVEAFERGFRGHELPIWEDLHRRGTLVRASLSPLDITSAPVKSARQYLVIAVFATDEGHEEHDSDPRFREWNALADAYQVGEAMAFGGDTILAVGD